MNPRQEKRLAPAAVGALLAGLLALAGCAPPAPAPAPELPRDTGPSAASAAVLHPYSDPANARRGPAAPRGSRPAAIDVELPGEPDRPWDGPPRTLPYAEALGRTGPAAPVAPAGPGVPAGGALRAGDRIGVAVAGHPEFGGEWTLDADGRAVIPDGGAFGVGSFTGRSFSAALGTLAGREPAEAARTIAARLRRFLRREPRVTVEVVAGGGER